MGRRERNMEEREKRDKEADDNGGDGFREKLQRRPQEEVGSLD